MKAGLLGVPTLRTLMMLALGALLVMTLALLPPVAGLAGAAQEGACVSFAAAEFYATGNTLRSVVSADFNGDGNMDVAVTSLDTDTASVLLGNGEGALGTAHNFDAEGGGRRGS